MHEPSVAELLRNGEKNRDELHRLERKAHQHMAHGAGKRDAVHRQMQARVRSGSSEAVDIDPGPEFWHSVASDRSVTSAMRGGNVDPEGGELFRIADDVAMLKRHKLGDTCGGAWACQENLVCRDHMCSP